MDYPTAKLLLISKKLKMLKPVKWLKVVRTSSVVFEEDRSSTLRKLSLEQSCGLLCLLSFAWMFL